MRSRLVPFGLGGALASALLITAAEALAVSLEKVKGGSE